MNCELKIASRETARWLRKRRFNEPVTSYYDVDGTLKTVGEDEVTSWNNPSHDKDARHQVYAAPTLALAQTWLREKMIIDGGLPGQSDKVYTYMYYLCCHIQQSS